jgi:hypothetical protein
MKNRTQKKKSNARASTESPDLRAEVEKRAYQIWLSEGSGHGSDLNHWLRAERELAGSPVNRPTEASA